jgi:flagellar hook assembly protein FlgD
VDYLGSNYPNPFNPETTISFGLKESGHVSLRVYDTAGRLVTVLIDESRPAGPYTVEWNGNAQNGSPVACGVYFYRLISKEFDDTKKMILLR